LVESQVIRSGLCNTFRVEQLSDGIHKAEHQYMIALYERTAEIGPDTVSYTTNGEVTGEGYQAGGAPLTARLAQLLDGVACLDFIAPIWRLATINGARGALIYNASLPGLNAVCVVDFGYEYTCVNGPMAPQLPEPGALTSLIQWA